MTDPQDFARAIILSLQPNNRELPALIIGQQRLGYSMLAAMTPDERARWGESVRELIEQFLQAVEKQRYFLILPDVGILLDVLPEDRWTMARVENGMTTVSHNGKLLLYTGADMAAL